MTYIYRNEGTRAVSVVIGVMLMMSIMFLAAAQYQLLIVPQQEKTTEISHHRTVSSQMGEIRTNILTAASNGAQSAQKLTMGTAYSQDLIFGMIPEVHQPNPYGKLKTQSYSQPIKIINAEGLGSAANYWPGTGKPCGQDGPDSIDSDNPDHCFQTQSFHYAADYNRFLENPEIIYENTLMYDYYDSDGDNSYDKSDRYVFHAEQNLVNSRTLNLVALTGNLKQARISAATVQTIPLSAPSQSITVTQNATDNPITVQIPSKVPIEVWRNKVLADQMASTNPDGYVKSVVSCGADCVEITMVKGEVYNLKLSRIHLTTREERSNVPSVKAAYVAWKGNDRVTIQENSTTEISAQVRDRYNNPVAGIKTKAIAEDSNGDCIGNFRSGVGNNCNGKNQPGEKFSGEDGTLTYYYEAPDVDSDTAITVQLLLDDAENTVANKGGDLSPELLAKTEETSSSKLVSSGPFGQPVLPKLRMGPISTDNTLRIINLQFTDSSVTLGESVRAYVTLDNTGHDTETATLSPTSSSRFTATPASKSISLAPGQRIQYMMKLRFYDTGDQTFQVGTGQGSVSAHVRVRPVSADVAPITIRNTIDKSNIKKTPSTFKDGDSIKREFQESQDIPPVKYNQSSYTFESNARGNLYQFQNIGHSDDRYTTIEGDSDVAPPDSIRTGIATGYIEDNNVYTMFTEYKFETGSPEYVKYSLMNSTGHVLDKKSNYFLPNTGGETVRAYQLTPEEANAIRQSNELYIVHHTPEGAVPTLKIDHMWFVSDETPLKRTTPNPSVTTDTSVVDTSVKTGQTYAPSATIENTGSRVATVMVRLYETNSNTGNKDAIRVREVHINPGAQKTVAFPHRQYDPGTYQYGIGIDGDGNSDTGEVSVEVSHR